MIRQTLRLCLVEDNGTCGAWKNVQGASEFEMKKRLGRQGIVVWKGFCALTQNGSMTWNWQI